MIKNFFHNKNILVTGHTGFKGSWLCQFLNLFNSKVTGFALAAEKVSLYNLLNLEKDINSNIADIRNFDQINRIVKDSKPEIIFHLASQPLVRYSYQHPIETWHTNVIGTANLFEAAKNCSQTKVIINVTSDKCYENKEWDFPYRENDRLGGYDPYSSSKAASEILSTSYRNSFFNKMGIKLATARAGNVIGGGDFSEDRIVPDIIRSIKNKKELQIRSPNAIRPWQHVFEPLAGYMILAMKLYNNENCFNAYNFGPYSYDKKTVIDLIKIFSKSFSDLSYNINEQETKKMHEAKTLILDSSLAINQLNWKPLYDCDRAINHTIEWYKIYLENLQSIKEYSTNQIENYLSKLKY